MLFWLVSCFSTCSLHSAVPMATFATVHANALPGTNALNFLLQYQFISDLYFLCIWQEVMFFRCLQALITCRKLVYSFCLIYLLYFELSSNNATLVKEHPTNQCNCQFDEGWLCQQAPKLVHNLSKEKVGGIRFDCVYSGCFWKVLHCAIWFKLTLLLTNVMFKVQLNDMCHLWLCFFLPIGGYFLHDSGGVSNAFSFRRACTAYRFIKGSCSISSLLRSLGSSTRALSVAMGNNKPNWPTARNVIAHSKVMSLCRPLIECQCPLSGYL